MSQEFSIETMFLDEPGGPDTTCLTRFPETAQPTQSDRLEGCSRTVAWESPSPSCLKMMGYGTHKISRIISIFSRSWSIINME
ncbi:MAG: hypothetical protein ACTSQ8_15075 [Candidatus Helarchaeota archaeon]